MRAVMRFSERIVVLDAGGRSPREVPTRSSATPRSRGPISVSRIVVDNVEAGYGSVRVLHGVSIRVEPGETVALLGTNGNGKSTLINCIMGIVRPATGAISLETDDGARVDLVGKTPRKSCELGISLVPEGAASFHSHCGREPDARRLSKLRAPTNQLQSGILVRNVPRARGAAAPARRLHVGGRAANAGDRARPDVGAPRPAG